jgi:hypothetical protein
MSRKCTDCRYCILEDYGYSNYTTEGTTAHCAKSLHPSGSEGYDSFYGEAQQHAYAAECIGFEPGEAIEVDCDRENLTDGTLNEAQLAIYREWEEKS